MLPPTPDQVDHLYDQLQTLIAELHGRGFNIGVDSYCAVYTLLLSLVGRGLLDGDFSALRNVIAPILCSSPQEQAEFYRLFDERFTSVAPPVSPVKPIDKILGKLQHQEKNTHFVMGLFFLILILPALLMGGLLLHPIWTVPAPQVAPQNATTTTETITISGVKVAPVPTPASQVESSKTPTEPEAPKTPPAQLAFWFVLALLIATLLWYVVPYLNARRFLSRHRVGKPPELDKFFKEIPLKPFSSVAFARTAQQLHKHRDLDAHLLDVAATVKRTIAAGGQFTPAYQAIKALPEYLVLIDRASFNDQLSAFVQSLLQELQDFGLFIEKYYFDRDPRRCYAERTPTVPCRLDALQARYPNHRLIIFSDSRHFVDPIHGKPYPWLAKFHEWQQSFLFTPESPSHWDYYKQQLHQAGFVVLATGQQGLATLVNYVSSDQAHAQVERDQADHYPALLQQRPLRFIERHAPDDETVAELLSQLQVYLQPDGFNWLAACAVYPELHWQLTLYLGQARAVEPLPVGANSFALFWKSPTTAENRANKFAPTDPTPTNPVRPEPVEGQTSPANSPSTFAFSPEPIEGSGRTGEGKIDEALLLALARLPWLRHGYMPDWLRLALLNKLQADSPQAEQVIRAQLAELLKSMLQGQAAQAQDLTLAIAQQSPSSLLKHLLPAWWKHSETLSQDFVFQSFMANRLAVSTRGARGKPVRGMVVLAAELLLLGVAGYFAWFAEAKIEPLPETLPPLEKLTASAVPPVAQKTPPIAPNKVSAVVSTNPVAPIGNTVSAVATVDAVIAPIQTAVQNALPATVSFKLDMVNIPAGSFVMGCQDGRDSDCRDNEKPAHKVQISAFQLGKTEVTQGQWKAVLGTNPSDFKDCGDNCPVEHATWDDIQLFIQKLNAQTGKAYRLPSESEWEYACRAGQDTKYCGGNNVNPVAWYDSNSDGKTHPVGGKQANAWGLYDMSGNVYEWVQDTKHSDYDGAPNDGRAWDIGSAWRMLRGGSWLNIPQDVRAAYRYEYDASERLYFAGFRLARTLP
ncbi:MAG: SUMF1/EgtB/PvdO family nonheme iron enzyme [Gallionella sp.]|nr:SUMF1/EgtB/PvdO family nonheme iron enzyme [Gallionella sp.]MDD4960259.1 SUMF1/EgtB/PvdO family nonheme iron enzyme [Gallionella sp.]